MAVQRRRRRRKRKRRQGGGALIKQQGSGWWQDFKRNTRQGYKETRDVIKQNKALQRVLSHSWYP